MLSFAPARGLGVGLVILVWAWSPIVHAQEPAAKDIVDRAESLLWGNTLQAELEMTVVTPRWKRTLTFLAWIDRPRRSFIRILSPAKEAGIGSLRIGSEMWNYLPAIERTIKIPPSMMMQPWMGSDFTNDDFVKTAASPTTRRTDSSPWTPSREHPGMAWTRFPGPMPWSCGAASS